MADINDQDLHDSTLLDAWVRRVTLGDPMPWDPLGPPWDELPQRPGIPPDRAARSHLDTVLALRRDRIATARECLPIVLNEEWEHRYAEHDLTALGAA